MSAEKLRGFKVLPLKFTNNSEPHYIYFKEHAVREQCEDKPSERTLFVLNIPPYATEESIQRVFSVAGKIVNVTFSQTPTTKQSKPRTSEYFNFTEKIIGFKVAYVVYKTASSLQKALTLTKLEPLSSEATPVLTGVRKWIHEYNASIPNVPHMQKEIDEYMKEFDISEEKRKEHEKSLGEADDEGWITVTKQGRNPGIARKESTESKIKNYLNAGKKRKELLNFYSFQIRENKMKHVVMLRQKFEEDKKKVALLKKNRKFKPF